MGAFQQAQKLMAKMNELQATLERRELVGEAGAGKVQVTLNGKGEVRGVKIDPVLLVSEDVEILEDLLMEAFREARQKVEEVLASETGKIQAGMPRMPGLF